MDHFIQYLVIASALIAIGFIVVGTQRVTILNPANPTALIVFVFSLIFAGLVWCRDWSCTRIAMIVARIRRTKARTFASMSLPEQAFNVTG